MSKVKVRQLANNSFAVEGGKADGWIGAAIYMATANNKGYVVLLNRDGKDSLFAAHYKDIEIYDETGTQVTCNSVSDVVSGLNAFVGSFFEGSGTGNDLSSQNAETITIDDNDTAGTIRVMEQADYDAIVTKVPDRIYYILEPIV